MKFRNRAIMLLMAASAATGGLAACGSADSDNQTAAIATTDYDFENDYDDTDYDDLYEDEIEEDTTYSDYSYSSSSSNRSTRLDESEMGVAANAAKELNDGNEQYLTGKANMDVSSSLRRNLADGQAPHTIVITCSDSRVPPELIFNADLGELFTIRTAGNVVGDYEIGSVEYAADHLGSQLILVMGHSGCGAVGAAIEGHADGDIEDIVEEIVPSVIKAQRTETDEAAVADKAEDFNVENSIARLRESAIISNLESRGKLKILGAKYDIETGEVNYFEEQ